MDHIIVRVSDYRVVEGGWLRMSFKNVAGDAGIAKVEVTPSKPEVRAREGEGWLAGWCMQRPWRRQCWR